MKKFRPLLVWITILLVAIVSFINIIFTFHVFNKTDEKNNTLFSQLTGTAKTNADKIKESEELIGEIAEKVAEIQRENAKKNPDSQPKDGKDGAKGEKGDSITGEKGEKGDKGDSIQGQTGATGANGLTPEIICNVEKNRWEVRYSEELGWEVVNGAPTKCTVTREDILQAFRTR